MTIDAIGGGVDALQSALQNDNVIGDGEAYDTVQAAVDGASDWVWIPPATFNEAVTIDTAGLTVEGSGYDTLIDGGTTGTAITISATDVTVSNLSVQTTAGQGNAYDGIKTATGAGSGVIENVWVRDSDRFGFEVQHADTSIVSCTVEASDSVGIRQFGLRGIVASCIVQSGVSQSGVVLGADDTIVVHTTVTSVNNRGIYGAANDQLIGGNRVHNSGSDGIFINGTDQLVFNNRISESTNSDLNTTNATSPTTDANVTGAAN